jgi:hypothetical protein
MAATATTAGCGGGSARTVSDGGRDAPVGADGPGDGAVKVDTGSPNAATLYVQSIRYNLTAIPRVDLLFVIDDSSGMGPLQVKLRQRLPDFMSVLKSLPGGLPDLQVAVVSTSLGAGVYANVTGCLPSSSGNLDGNFQHKAGCGLHAGETFLKSARNASGRTANFDGEIGDVVSCVADLGQNGCTFEHPFEALRLALQKTQVQGTDNGGFLRADAYLAVVILTNEDDCSVPADSMLFDPNQQRVADPLGGLQSYRCNEFGHKCNQALPHAAPATAATMTGCVSAEDGTLVTVDGIVQFMRSIKAMPMDQLVLAAIAGPTEPYVVEPRSFTLATGAAENQPSIKHSCTSGSAGLEYGDPAIRIKQFLEPFAGILESVCADDYRDSMVRIAEVIARKLRWTCFPGVPLNRADGQPDCVVTLRTTAGGQTSEQPVPLCGAPGVGPFPCWRFASPTSATCETGGRGVDVCYEATCDPTLLPADRALLLMSCAIAEPPPR